jgi:DNA-directed RNA polymerase specialized sigma24 family protein
MKWLSKIAEHHKEYIEIVKNFGEKSYAEDIVQEFYLRLHKYANKEKIINENGEVNKIYIFYALRNTYLLYWKKKKKFVKINIDDLKNIGVNFEYIPRAEAENILESKIKKEMQSWEWFDARLFKLYREEQLSMRELSKRTQISTKTIFYTIKRCKERLRENIAEDYEDFINGDFEKI